jgi:hypothetical protein
MEAVKNMPTCTTVTNQALAALRSAVAHLPPRPTTHASNEPFQPTPKSGPGTSTAPSAKPDVHAFPSQQEQLGTVCPSCHAPAKGADHWKDLGSESGHGPGGQMTEADKRRLREWVEGQQTQ